MTVVARTWSKLERVLELRWPARLESLREGATKAELGWLRKQVRTSLPSDLLASLAIHNGQQGEDLWDLWSLLSTEEIAAQWAAMSRQLAVNAWSNADGWWRPSWIPVCADGCGDLLCVDMAPGPKGTSGQVVWFRHDDAGRTVVAKSFSLWLAKAARELPTAGEDDDRVGPITVGRGRTARRYRDSRQAIARLLAGEWKPAKRAIDEFAETGDPDATAARAYVAAYEQDWPSVIENARAVAAYAEDLGGEVIEDLARLGARAGEHTGDWDSLQPLAKALGAYWKPNPLRACIKNRTDSLNRVDLPSARDLAKMTSAYARWIEAGDDARPAFQLVDEDTRRSYDFVIACSHHQWDAALKMLREGLPAALGSTTFTHVAHTIQWALLQGHPQLGAAPAWKLTFASLDQWMPLSPAQALPAQWVTMEGLRDIMTPARRRKVLATPKAQWLR